jgi:hypothetical protein
MCLNLHFLASGLGLDPALTRWEQLAAGLLNLASIFLAMYATLFCTILDGNPKKKSNCKHQDTVIFKIV